MGINYLDLFSGIGGFHKGILDAGIKIKKSYYSEVDKYAIQIYKKHFPESEYLGTVESVDGTKLPRLNIVTFGFPCQDLSIAGKRAGLKGRRSGLFNEAIRIINENKPDYFIFENVKGLFSSNRGKDFDFILRTVANIGYDGQWQLLNTKWFLPQSRERIYFVGHIGGQRRPEVFPVGQNETIRNESATSEKTICNTIKARDYSNWNGNYIIENVPQAHRVNSIGSDIRRLTPKECERLQGFPDGWTSGISDSQRYKCLGNAASVPVVREVIRKLFNGRIKNKICTTFRR